MKKIWALLLVMAMGVSITACGSKEDVGANGGTGKQKVTVWAWDPSFNIAIMNEAKVRYEADNPDVEIEILDFGKTDVEQKLHTNLASGSKKGLPEVVLIEDYNVQKYLQSYPGAFHDLTGKINHKDFAGYKVDAMTLENKIYGVPFDSGVAGFYFRRDLIEEAGYTEADIQNITWDEYIEIGKAVKEKTGKYMLTLDPSDGGIIRLMMQSAGSWFFDADGNPSIKGNEALGEILRIYKGMMDAGISKPITGWTEFTGAFNTGDVASIITGAWITPTVMSEESQNGLWGIAPVPRLDIDSSINASNLGGSSWYVLEASDNAEIAVDFLNKTFGQDVDFYQTILKDIGAIGNYVPALVGEAYKEEKEFFGGQAIYDDFAKWIAQIPPVNYGTYTWEADGVLMAEILNVLNGMPIEEALANTEVQVIQQVE